MADMPLISVLLSVNENKVSAKKWALKKIVCHSVRPKRRTDSRAMSERNSNVCHTNAHPMMQCAREIDSSSTLDTIPQQGRVRIDTKGSARNPERGQISGEELGFCRRSVSIENQRENDRPSGHGGEQRIGLWHLALIRPGTHLHVGPGGGSSV
jgi:hypothetical protein